MLTKLKKIGVNEFKKWLICQALFNALYLKYNVILFFFQI